MDTASTATHYQTWPPITDRVLAVCLASVALAAGYVVGLIPGTFGALVLVGPRPEGVEVGL